MLAIIKFAAAGLLLVLAPLALLAAAFLPLVDLDTVRRGRGRRTLSLVPGHAGGVARRSRITQYAPSSRLASAAGSCAATAAVPSPDALRRPA